jgi:transposase-like protein
VTVGDRSVAEIAENLEIGASLLSKWGQSQRHDGEQAFRGHGKRTAVEDESWRLQPSCGTVIQLAPGNAFSPIRW